MKNTLIYVILALSLTGCASTPAQNQQALDDLGEIVEGAGAAILGAAILTAPVEQTTTETRTCDKDWSGNETCTTTRKGNAP